MQKALAKHGVRVAFNVNRQLEDYLHVLRAHTDEAEYEAYRIGITEAMHKIGVALINEAIDRFPEIHDEIDLDIGTYERVL